MNGHFMSDLDLPTASELARQVQQHLESLRAAGIEWLPAFKASSALTLPGKSTRDSARSESGGVAEGTTSQCEGSIMASTSSNITEKSQFIVEDRGLALHVLASTVAGCTRCAELFATRTQTVFGVGKLEPDLCFI